MKLYCFVLKGGDYLDQIQRQIAVLGTPKSDDISYINNDSVLKYIRSLPKRSKQSFKTLFPNANPLGLDLLAKMLAFNPEKRYTVEECLKHEYFKGLYNPEEEPISENQFDWSWDNFEPTKEKIQNMIYEESLQYHPEKKKR